MPKENKYDKLRIDCHNKAYDCDAMKYIFEKRAKRLKGYATTLKAFGIIVPSLIGSVALSYQLESPFLQFLVSVAVPCMIIQFIISLWALVAEWDNELSYSYEAIQSYSPLFAKYKNIADYPPEEYITFKSAVDVIDLESSFREQQDTSHNVKEWEKRMGMRYSLREHKCSCYGCKVIPLSMESTACDVCGKFSFKYQTLIHKLYKS